MSQEDFDADETPQPGPDPDNPCPKCKAITMAPVDGSGRICFTCGWTWMVGDPPDKGEYMPEMIWPPDLRAVLKHITEL